MTLREKIARTRFGRSCHQLSWEEHRELDHLLGVPADAEPILCLDGVVAADGV